MHMMYKQLSLIPIIMESHQPVTEKISNRNSVITLTFLTIPCSGPINYKTKFQHFQVHFDADSRTLPVFKNFPVLENLEIIEDQQEPYRNRCCIHKISSVEIFNVVYSQFQDLNMLSYQGGNFSEALQ